jgi:hypothetical protein
LWAKGLTGKDVHKEMFPLYSGEYLSRKAVHNWIEKVSQGHSKVTDDTRPGAEVAETTAKILLFCRFQITGKAKCINVSGEYVEKLNIFFRVRILLVLRFTPICNLRIY